MNLKQILAGFVGGFLCALLLWTQGGSHVAATTHEVAQSAARPLPQRMARGAETAQAGGCTGDLNNDNVVDGADLLMLLANWGLCSTGCTDSNDCAAGETCCGGSCVDLMSDSQNCGDCNLACGQSEWCWGGQCFPSSCTMDSECPDGFYCSDQSSECTPQLPKGSPCNAGNQCQDGLVCFGGFCTMPPTWYRDNDEDGWGDCDDFIMSFDPIPPYTATECGDCDDDDPNTYPGAVEFCDGTDNDCDGTIDNDPADAGASCDTGMEGQCAAGTIECIDASLTCVSILGPSEEVCDGIDNDCNGIVDDIPNAGESCDTGLPGQCAEGVIVCEFGNLSCTPVNGPVPEVCNDGIDNSCNGLVDCDDPACDGHPECR